jgi:lipoate-protein ligase A
MALVVVLNFRFVTPGLPGESGRTMKCLDLALDTPAENLACDEALLDLCEAGQEGEILRFWESSRSFVVVGYANKVESEVDVDACRRAGIPILRRCSGGGTVVQGPGCLNYSLVLRIDEAGPTGGVAGTNSLVMSAQREALQPLHSAMIEVKGHTDLAIGGIKFSGNAQRRRRRSLLFHGSLLLDFDLDLIGSLLRMPSHEPDYRQSRPHRAFVANFPVSSAVVKEAIRIRWNALEPMTAVPRSAVMQLVEDRYGQAGWNFKF